MQTKPSTRLWAAIPGNLLQSVWVKAAKWLLQRHLIKKCQQRKATSLWHRLVWNTALRKL
jgi:hypothetical protein